MMSIGKVSALAFVMGMVLTGPASWAAPAYVSACSGPIAWDAFARGTLSAFVGGDRQPRYSNEFCYFAGVEHARLVRSQVEASVCEDEFKRGYQDGATLAPGPKRLVCFQLGYHAGVADLHIATREGDTSIVSDDCVKLYAKGGRHRRNYCANSSYSINKPELKRCYAQGWNEGDLFRENRSGSRRSPVWGDTCD